MGAGVKRCQELVECANIVIDLTVQSMASRERTNSRGCCFTTAIGPVGAWQVTTRFQTVSVSREPRVFLAVYARVKILLGPNLGRKVSSWSLGAQLQRFLDQVCSCSCKGWASIAGATHSLFDNRRQDRGLARKGRCGCTRTIPSFEKKKPSNGLQLRPCSLELRLLQPPVLLLLTLLFRRSLVLAARKAHGLPHSFTAESSESIERPTTTLDPPKRLSPSVEGLMTNMCASGYVGSLTNEA